MIGEAISLGKNDLQEVDGGIGLGGQGNGMTVQFFYRKARKEQHAFDGTVGTDGNVGKKQIFSGRFPVFYGRGGTHIDFPAAQHAIQVCRNTSEKAIIGAIEIAPQRSEDRCAVSVLVCVLS